MARHLYIAGADRWIDYIRDSLSIEQALTYQIDTARFQVKGAQPNEGDEVIIEDDTLGRLFAGVIVRVDLADTMPDRTVSVWQIECDDYTEKLNQKLVVETYRDLPADSIFRDIVTKYCQGFTVNGVRTGAPIIEELVFDYVQVSDAFKQLCDYVGWHWQPDYYKDLSFFSPEELAVPAPFTLTPGGYFRNLKHSIDTQGLRNRVYVKGGTMLSDPFTHEIKADGVSRVWNLPHKPHDISMTVGGITKTCGIENVHKDADFDYLMNYQEKYVRASSQTTTQIDGTSIAFTYKFDIDVITSVDDEDSQEAIALVQGGDGIYEYVITDESLTTLDAAEAVGQADLRDHANPQVKGSFETDTHLAIDTITGETMFINPMSPLEFNKVTYKTIGGWKPGQLVTINLPDRGIENTFLIQRVIIEPATPIHWTYRVEYGGRLFGIADFLKALVSSQQKKRVDESKVLHKVNVKQDKLSVSDEITSTPRTPPFKCGDADAICGFVVCG